MGREARREKRVVLGHDSTEEVRGRLSLCCVSLGLSRRTEHKKSDTGVCLGGSREASLVAMLSQFKFSFPIEHDAL